MAEALNVPIKVTIETAQAKTGLKEIATAARSSAKEIAPSFDRVAGEIGRAGQDAGKRFARGIDSAGDASRRTAKGVATPFRSIAGDMDRAGAKAGKAYARGLSDEIGKGTQAAAEKQRTSLSSVAGSIAVAGAFAKGAQSFLDFESSMSEVQAVSGATAEQFAVLRQQAIDLGASTTFSASQVAQAEGELTRAGMQISEVLGGGLKGSLDLAAAGGLDVAKAAETMASSLNMFGLSGKDAAHVADVFANGANKSAADVEGLSMSLAQAGTSAAQLGVPLEDTVAVMSLFADKGIKGADAGTSFKTMLASFTPNSKQAREAMAALNLEFFDAQGVFVGMPEAVRRMGVAFNGLTDEERAMRMETIFGSDAVRAASMLFDSTGDTAKAAGKSFGDYASAMRVTGTASKQAATMTDNLKGDLEQLGGAIESAFIQAGTGANDGLRLLVGQLTGLVGLLGKVPAPALAAGVGLAALFAVGPKAAEFGNSLSVGLKNFARDAGEAGRASTVAASPIKIFGAELKRVVDTADGGTRFTALGKATSAASTGFSAMRTAGSGLFAALGGPWGLAVAGAGAGLGLLAEAQSRAAEKAQQHQTYVEALAASLDKTTGAVTKQSRELVAQRLASEGGMEFTKQWGVSARELSDAMLGNETALNRVRGAIQSKTDAEIAGIQSTDQYSNNTGDVAEAIGRSGQAATEARGWLDKMAGGLGEARDKQKFLNDALDESKPAADKAAAGQKGVIKTSSELDAALKEAAKQTERLSNELKRLDGGMAGYLASYDEWQAGPQKLTEALKANGKGFEGMGKAALANREALRGYATETANYISGAKEMNISNAEIVANVSTARAKFIEMAQAMGASAPRAREMADAMGLIPKDVQVMLDASAVEDGGLIVDKTTGKITTLGKAVADLSSKDAKVRITAENNVAPKLAEAVKQIDGRTGKVKIDGNTDAAKAKAKALQQVIDRTGGMVKVDGNLVPANKRLRELVQKINGTKGVAVVDANNTPAKKKAVEAKAVADKTRGTISISGNNAAAMAEVREAKGAADRARGVISVGANVAAARQALDFLTRPRTVTITARQVGAAFSLGGWANGGVVDYYANGAIREKHVAQIAPAGTWRVWAEDETGGEAYIPLHPSKRKRSIDIWQETGRRLGIFQADGSVLSFASGGTADWGSIMGGYSSGYSARSSTLDATKRQLEEIYQALKKAGEEVGKAAAAQRAAAKTKGAQDDKLANQYMATWKKAQEYYTQQWQAAYRGVQHATAATQVGSGVRFNQSMSQSYKIDEGKSRAILAIKNMGYTGLALRLAQDDSPEARSIAIALANNRTQAREAATRLAAADRQAADYQKLIESMDPVAQAQKRAEAAERAAAAAEREAEARQKAWDAYSKTPLGAVNIAAKKQTADSAHIGGKLANVKKIQLAGYTTLARNLLEDDSEDAWAQAKWFAEHLNDAAAAEKRAKTLAGQESLKQQMLAQMDPNKQAEEKRQAEAARTEQIKLDRERNDSLRAMLRDYGVGLGRYHPLWSSQVQAPIQQASTVSLTGSQISIVLDDNTALSGYVGEHAVRAVSRAVTDMSGRG